MTGLQPVSDNLEIPETLSESDPLMAQALEIQGKAGVTYGQNPGILVSEHNRYILNRASGTGIWKHHSRRVLHKTVRSGSKESGIM